MKRTVLMLAAVLLVAACDVSSVTGLTSTSRVADARKPSPGGSPDSVVIPPCTSTTVKVDTVVVGTDTMFVGEVVCTNPQ